MKTTATIAKLNKQYRCLYVSLEDFRHASTYANFILKKGWHYYPWERRGSIYVQQSAFTLALIVSYYRPFGQGDRFSKLLLSLISYDAADEKMHDELQKLRNEVFAHSDLRRYEVQPISIFGKASAIVGGPFGQKQNAKKMRFFRLSAEETQRVRGMTAKAIAAINSDLEKLIRKMNEAKNSSSV